MELPDIWYHVIHHLNSNLSKTGIDILELIAKKLKINNIDKFDAAKYLRTVEGKEFETEINNKLLSVSPALLEHVRNMANLRLVNNFFNKLLDPFIIGRSLKIKKYSSDSLGSCLNKISSFSNSIIWFKAFLINFDSDMENIDLLKLIFKIIVDKNLKYLKEVLNLGIRKELMDQFLIVFRGDAYREIRELIDNHYEEK